MPAHPECAARDRPRFEIADIVRAHRGSLEKARSLSTEQRRALSAIALCRTAVLGGHLDVCTSCGHDKPSYNSCRNRHCPKCQALAQEKWISQRLSRVLPVAHFHVVFTLPASIRPLAAYRPRLVYDLLFEAASAALLEVGRGPKLGARLGVTAVLHTWTRELELHPHVHCIVTAGGLAVGEQRWKSCRRGYLLPVRVLGAVFRGKFLDGLRRARRRGQLDGFDAFADPQGFDNFCSRISRRRWVVYAKKPFAGVQQVFSYLGRYTHRVGIANSRLLDVGHDHVTFRTRGSARTTLAPIEFLRRFVQHVLPGRYVKIRHFGLYAASHVTGALERARELVPRDSIDRPRVLATYLEILLALNGHDVRVCERCGEPVRLIPISVAGANPNARAPP